MPTRGSLRSSPAVAGAVAASLGVALLELGCHSACPAARSPRLLIFLTASGARLILSVLAVDRVAPRLGLRRRASPPDARAPASCWPIAFANIVVTALLMFISPHDLGLLGLLLGFSAIVAIAFAV